MKKKLILTLFVTVFITCFAVVQAHAVLVTLDVLDDYIMVDEDFDVEVWVEDDSTPDLGDLTAFGFDVDPLGSLSFFSYVGYAVGPDYDDVGYNFDNSLAPNYVGGWYTGIGNADQNVHLATLSFTAGPVTGTDTLGIEGLFDGWDHGLFYELGDEDIVAFTDITINQAAAPVPEPATMLLLGTGLAGLVGFRKKLRKR